jgi:hypothetical protein
LSPGSPGKACYAKQPRIYFRFSVRKIITRWVEHSAENRGYSLYHVSITPVAAVAARGVHKSELLTQEFLKDSTTDVPSTEANSCDLPVPRMKIALQGLPACLPPQHHPRLPAKRQLRILYLIPTSAIDLNIVNKLGCKDFITKSML